VNVIAPLVTNEQGMIRQTIYFPYLWALKYAKGQALDVAVQSAQEGGIPHIDAAVTFDPTERVYAVLMLNRDLAKDQEATLLFRDDAPTRVVGFETITGPDLKVSNTFAAPDRVKPAPLDPPRVGERMVIKLPRQSYSVLRLRA
jgi:alpha-N-arabinofuranosidase